MSTQLKVAVRPARIVGAARRKLRHAQWRRRARAFYSQFVARGDLCFDVGAHVGDRTAVFRSLGASVVAVEPQQHCVDGLTRRFPEPEVTIVRSALGASLGEGRLRPGSVDTTSSLSADWIDSVVRSGRFSDLRWGEPVSVPMTTLDELIGEFGLPVFCKIDVEGYEREVLEGLSRPIRTVAFEFTPEFLGATVACVERLDDLGRAEFNYALGEAMKLELDEWLSGAALADALARLGRPDVFGDVYARFRELG